MATVDDVMSYAGPTEEEMEEMRRVKEEKKKEEEAMAAELKAFQEAEEAEERKRREEEWAERLAVVKKEELELMETQSIPLRNYLMKHVMPTLTQGLVDCCKVRPDDAVDYLPIKLFIHGPPASGKTTLAERLCQRYKLHHIKLAPVLDAAVAMLEHRYMSEVEDEQSDEEENDDKQLARRIQSVREEARERAEIVVLEDVLDEHHITRFVREKLLSMLCQNQGFVLDGYPKTYEQSKDLFVVDDGEESSPEEGCQVTTDPQITPAHVFVLTATDDFLRERVLHMPEIKLMQSYKSDMAYARLLAEYRDANHENETKNAVSIFAEENVAIEHLDVMTDKNINMDETFKHAVKKLGNVTTMEESEHEKEVSLMNEVILEVKRQADTETAAQIIAQQVEEQRKLDEQEKMHAYEKSIQEEMDILTEMSLPLRNYLMSFVLPTLIKGLTEICRERPGPEACIDVLAEYLYKNNPQQGYNFPGPLPWREDESDFSHDELVRVLRQGLHRAATTSRNPRDRPTRDGPETKLLSRDMSRHTTSW